MDDQPLTYLLTGISQVGFPIVLTGYLLVRFEKKLEMLTESILKLIEVINNKNTSEGSHGQ
ncbi:YvrJ family protein [Cohnella endophytica]|uniref:YvrJ family protein n=1 Tax=Cohnella endophytica TaxID=2419778 RepID=A0A494XL40_9BACL|nr:YvrJ family protein [Cohnella endophytica]RKP51328.1 YvrJ family protein [Cohnella endophytica]